jgi:hypothetical protein
MSRFGLSLLTLTLLPLLPSLPAYGQGPGKSWPVQTKGPGRTGGAPRVEVELTNYGGGVALAAQVVLRDAAPSSPSSPRVDGGRHFV